MGMQAIAKDLGVELWLRQLPRDVARLWPAVPEMVEGPRGMDAWLGRANLILGRLEGYRARLRELQTRASSQGDPNPQERIEEQRILDENDAEVDLPEKDFEIDEPARARPSPSSETSEARYLYAWMYVANVYVLAVTSRQSRPTTLRRKSGSTCACHGIGHG